MDLPFLFLFPQDPLKWIDPMCLLCSMTRIWNCVKGGRNWSAWEVTEVSRKNLSKVPFNELNGRNTNKPPAATASPALIILFPADNRLLISVGDFRMSRCLPQTSIIGCWSSIMWELVSATSSKGEKWASAPTCLGWTGNLGMAH